MSKPVSKEASSQAAWHLLMQGVTEARTEAHRIRHMVNRAKTMVDRSSQKEHLYEEAGDVIVGLPTRLSALERVLDRTALALSKMGDDFLSARLPLSDKQLVDDATEPAFGGGQSKNSDLTASRLARRWMASKTASASPLALKLIEVMSREGGKTSMVNINILQEALELLGWSVSEGTGAARLNDDAIKYLYGAGVRVDPSGLASGSLRFFAPFSAGEPSRLWFKDGEKDEAEKALARIKRKFTVSGGKKGPSNPQRGEYYVGSLQIKSLPDGGSGWGDRWEIEGYNYFLGVPTFTFKAPGGDSVELVSPVNRRGLAEDITQMKIPRFWTWAYKNGLQQAAQEYLASGGMAVLEKERREKELSLRSLDNTGTCPVCFKNVKMISSRKVISRHGWKVQGGGWRNFNSWHSGSCEGVGYQPFELSKDGTVHYRKLVEQAKEQIKKQISDLGKQPPLKTLDSRRKERVYNPEDQGYQKVWRKQMEQAKRYLQSVEEDLRDLDSKIANWKQTALPGSI